MLRKPGYSSINSQSSHLLNNVFSSDSLPQLITRKTFGVILYCSPEMVSAFSTDPMLGLGVYQRVDTNIALKLNLLKASKMQDRPVDKFGKPCSYFTYIFSTPFIPGDDWHLFSYVSKWLSTPVLNMHIHSIHLQGDKIPDYLVGRFFDALQYSRIPTHMLWSKTLAHWMLDEIVRQPYLEEALALQIGTFPDTFASPSGLLGQFFASSPSTTHWSTDKARFQPSLPSTPAPSL